MKPNKLISVLASFTMLSGTAIAQDLSFPQAEDVWYTDGQKTLQYRLTVKPIDSLAKNVILFIGDGNDPTTIVATRIFEGQLAGNPGEENILSYEALPHVAYSKTYNTNAQTPDSAGTASAIMTGVKTISGVINLTKNVKRGSCKDALENPATSLAELAEAAGLATGIVTTTRITHATPASFFAHSADRNWEDNTKLPEGNPDGCKDIAAQLIDFPFGDGIDVAMGGGRANFIGKEDVDAEDPSKTGKRTDGRNLVEEWTAKSNNHVVIHNQAEFDALDVSSNPNVLALFNGSHMQYEASRAKDKGGEPSLAEMTKKAIEILSQKGKGYFLVIEGGRIDHASHGNKAYYTLTDGVAFSDAVQVAIDITNTDETLIVVTADHGHEMTLSGYAQRGNPILGLVKDINFDGTPSDKFKLAADGKPYTVISFANGRSSPFNKDDKPVVRPDLTNVDTQDPKFIQPSLVPTSSETHGGQDVGIYASGPKAYLFDGVVEQNYIFHVIEHALDLRHKSKP